MSFPVIIADYDPEWPRRFEEEKARITEALEGLDVIVEHVGSTSVPGLAAKPIVDMMVGFRDWTLAPRTVEPLVALGYTYYGEFEFPRLYYLSKDFPSSYHIYLMARDHPQWERHLKFRDYLRAHPETAQSYKRFKRTLAEKHRNDVDAYFHAKAEFVHSIDTLASGK